MGEREKGSKHRYILHVLRFLVAAGALYLAFRGEDVKAVLGLLREVRGWIFLSALGLYIVSQLIFVARWLMFLRVQSIRIGYWPAVRLHFLGLFYNNCLPSAVGGDVLRAWYVTKHTDKKVEAALSVVVDRVIGLAGLLIMAIAGCIFVPARGREEIFRSYSQIGLIRWMGHHRWLIAAFLVVMTAGVLALLSRKGGRQWIQGLVGRVSRRGAEALSTIHKAVRIYYDRKLAILAGLLLTFACQGIFVLGLAMLGREIGVSAEMKYYFIFFPVSWLLGTIPISPGGGGVVEWAVKVMFKATGVSGEQALALALWQRLLWLLGSLPGAAIHIAGIHLPKEIPVDLKTNGD